MNILLIGPSASGKGTQAEKLVSRFNLGYLEMGGLLRKISKEETPLGYKVNEYINIKGQLVPDEIIIEVVNSYLNSLGRLEGILFDGFPRIVSQAKIFEEFLAKKGKKLDLAIYLKVPRQIIFDRIASRRICEQCGLAYNLITNPPKTENFCDRCGGKLVIRGDETPEKIEARLDWFEKQTKPMIRYYQKQGILEEVDGNRPIEKIASDIVVRLKKRGLVSDGQN